MRALLTAYFACHLLHRRPPDLEMCCRCERWLLPRDTRDAALCESCRAALPWIESGLCVFCQQRRPLRESDTCQRCRARPPLLASCTAAVYYEGEILRWIRRFKYPERGLRGLDPSALGVVGLLAKATATRVPGPEPDLIVAVPQAVLDDVNISPQAKKEGFEVKTSRRAVKNGPRELGSDGGLGARKNVGSRRA